MMILRGHKGAVTGLAFSPDGRQLASSSRDSTVRVWDLSGREVRRFDSPWPALCVAWSPDHKRIATGYDSTSGLVRSGAVQYWESPLWDRPRSPIAHSDACHSVSFVSNTALVSAGAGEVMRQDSIEFVGSWRAPGAFIDRAHVSSNERPIAILASGSVQRIRPDCSGAREITRGFIAGSYTALQFSPAAQTIACSGDNHIGLWSETVRSLPRTWRAHDDRVMSIAYLADGQSLLSAGLDGLVKRWELTDFTALSVHDFGVGDCYSLAVSPDGLLAAVGGLEDIVVWDLGE